jgi:hypothetical protein
MEPAVLVWGFVNVGAVIMPVTAGSENGGKFEMWYFTFLPL